MGGLCSQQCAGSVGQGRRCPLPGRGRGGIGDACSETEVNLPWRLLVLSRERRVMQGSVQDFSPLNPGGPRRVFSQTPPFAAYLRLSSGGQDLGSARSCLYTQTLLSWLSAPSWGSCSSTGAPAFPGPSPAAEHVRLQLLQLCTCAATIHLHGHSHLGCGADGCGRSLVHLGGGRLLASPCPPRVPALPTSGSFPLSFPRLWEQRAGVLSLFGPSLSLQPPE